MTTQEKIDVMIASLNGEVIECKTHEGNWKELTCPVWNWEIIEYRIRPKETDISSFKYFRVKLSTDARCTVECVIDVQAETEEEAALLAKNICDEKTVDWEETPGTFDITYDKVFIESVNQLITTCQTPF